MLVVKLLSDGRSWEMYKNDGEWMRFISIRHQVSDWEAEVRKAISGLILQKAEDKSFLFPT